MVAIPGFAQKMATLSGRVIDASTSEPLPYSTVALLDQKEGKLMTGLISDGEGKFVFAQVPTGTYTVKISFVGYEDQEIPLLIGELNQAYDLGKIRMVNTGQQLDEVAVTARQEIVSSGLDKKSFGIEDNISQSGGSVLDAMRNLPGITVDPEGKVILRGSDQVSVLIDGKSSSLTGFGNQKGLANIPASNIERIEIINNPSAKYNAAGMAGIVNIIYKKGKEVGWNGEVGLIAGVGELNQRRENLPNISSKFALTPKINTNLSLNYRTGKINLFLQADGISRKRVNENTFTTRKYTGTTPDVSSQFLENRTQKLYNLKAGLDWDIDEKNTLTLFALRQYEEHIDQGDVPYDNLETGIRRRLWLWREDETTKFINYSASIAHRFEQPGHSLTLSYLYTGGGEDELFPFSDSSAARNSTDATRLLVNEYVHSINLDYVKPLRAGRLELGSRINLRSIPISYVIIPGENSILDPNLGRYSKYIENVYAFYGSYIWQKKNFDLEAGMRFEPTDVKYRLDPANAYYSTTSYKYLPLFPNIRFTRNLNENNIFSLFYNRRVDRPGEFDVRPFPKYDDPEVLKTGNPALRPQFTQNFEAAYKRFWKQGSLYGSAFYRRIDGIISRIFTQDAQAVEAIINTITQNLGKGTNLGLEFVLDQKLTKNWTMNASLNGYRNHINAFSGTQRYPYVQAFQFEESSTFTWNFKVNSNAKFGNGWDFQLSSQYYAPDIIPQGRIKDRYSLDFGLRKKVWKNKAEVWMSATDILNTFQIEREITGPNVSLTAYNYYETQVVSLGTKFKF